MCKAINFLIDADLIEVIPWFFFFLMGITACMYMVFVVETRHLDGFLLIYFFYIPKHKKFKTFVKQNILF